MSLQVFVWCVISGVAGLVAAALITVRLMAGDTRQED